MRRQKAAAPYAQVRAQKIKMDKDLKEYRTELIRTVQKLNENYDKLIVTLAGGALGLSIVFLKDVIKQDQIQSPTLLFVAWILFILSLSSVLGSLLFGIAANKKAIKQVDDDTIYNEEPGGVFSKFTKWLHYSGTVLLVAGLFFIAAFACKNMGIKNVKETKTNSAKAASKAVITQNK